MENLDLLLKNLTGKDEEKAQKAACYLVNNTDIELFKMLVVKSDFLFDFVRHNVCKRIEKAISKNNYMNILKFFDEYSPYYDDLFASILSKHASQDLTDEIFDMLEKGSTSQKTYAAKYFSYIPDTVALEPLGKYAFNDDENLSYNAAEALGQMRDDISFDIALSTLSSNDDFEVLKSVKFFVAYGKDYPLKEIFLAMKKSKMPENIAGQIPYMESLLNLLTSDYKLDALQTIDNILNGLGEILPLADIFQFELYEIIEYLLKINAEDSENASLIAEILLTALSKFTMFCENQEYIFDEDKDTKQEITSILNLLKSPSKEFWENQKHFLISELDKEESRILTALPVIAEFSLKEAVDKLVLLTNSDNEALVCEVLTTLKNLNALDKVNVNKISERIQNPNIKAVIDSIR